MKLYLELRARIGPRQTDSSSRGRPSRISNQGAFQRVKMWSFSDTPASESSEPAGTPRSSGSTSRRGTIDSIDQRVEGVETVLGKVPLAEMFGYTTQLRSLTQGRATSIMEFFEYRQVPKQLAEDMLY